MEGGAMLLLGWTMDSSAEIYKHTICMHCHECLLGPLGSSVFYPGLDTQQYYDGYDELYAKAKLWTTSWVVSSFV